jgi:hypothetical protein
VLRLLALTKRTPLHLQALEQSLLCNSRLFPDTSKALQTFPSRNSLLGFRRHAFGLALAASAWLAAPL